MHTQDSSLRHKTLSAQLLVGVALLSASFFISEDSKSNNHLIELEASQHGHSITVQKKCPHIAS